MGLVLHYRRGTRRAPVATHQRTSTFGEFYSILRSYVYTNASFYALFVFLKEWAYIKKGLNII